MANKLSFDPYSEHNIDLNDARRSWVEADVITHEGQKWVTICSCGKRFEGPTGEKVVAAFERHVSEYTMKRIEEQGTP